jgi:hypothetical protein
MRRILVFAAVLALSITVPSFAVTRSWTGSGTTNNWSDSANWGGSVPVAGDTLVFPNGSPRLSSTNDLAAGVMFQSLVFNGAGYVIDGNMIGLIGGLSGAPTFNAAVRLGATQTFDMGPSAVFNGAIDLNGFNLAIAGYDLPVNGVISGTGNVILNVGVRLNGNNTYTGTTTITAASFGGINGSQPQSDVTANGTLTGSGGTLGNVLVNWVFAPGPILGCCASSNGTGLVSTKNLTFASGSSFSDVEIDGATPGSGYDQVKVTGTVNIAANVTINLTLSPGFTPSAGQVFTLIDNDGTDPVNGSFSNMPGGTTVTLNGLYPFRISYAGGDGNDVTLTCTFGPKTWTGAVSNLWSNGGNWSDGVAPIAGDKLIFPPGALNQSNANDLAAGVMFQSLVFTGAGYVIDGNTIGLTGGLSLASSLGETFNAPFRLGATQTFDMGPGAAFNGAIDLNGFNLAIAGYDLPVNGVISGAGNVALDRGVRLNGNNSYTGTTTITAASVGGINGSQPQSDVTAIGTLNGSGGTLGNVLVNSIFAPGPLLGCCASSNGTGLMSTRNLTFASGSAFSDVEIAGVTPGSGYDQVKVTGTVSIAANVTINLKLSSGFTPSAGQVFTLIDNDGTDSINGSFSNIPEGTSVALNGHPFRISYAGGDGNDVTLTALIESATSLSQSAGTTKFGEALIVTATVVAQSGTPTGSVTFASDGVTIGTAPTQNGVATLTVVTLSPRTHAIVATFLGAGVFADSASGGISHIVSHGQTTTVITSNSPSTFYGQTARFSVAVSAQAPASGQATGSVSLFADAALLGTVPVVSGTATFDTSALHPGAKSITATYSGDANFDGSNAPAIQQNVAKAQTEVDARPRSGVLVGQPPIITVFVNVTPGSALVPSGIVSISESGATLGTQALIGGGANFILNPLTPGDHTLIVNYSGDADFEASSEAVIQSVGAPALSIHGTRVVEGNRGVTNVSLVISLSTAVAETVRVSFSTSPGTATAGEDYESASGVIELAPGELTHAIELHVFGDTNPEADETFSVLLSAPLNATIDTPSALVVIANDDQVPPRRRPSGH